MVLEAIAADMLAGAITKKAEIPAPSVPPVIVLDERAYKGEPKRVFEHQSANALSDIAVDCRKFNAALVEVIVTGATPSATISVEGASESGGAYFALPGSNVSQTAVAANTVFVVPVPTAWLKVRIASISGTFGSGLGYTITVTPFVAGGIEPTNIEIGGVPPQMDDTDKVAVSLYVQSSTAGDTAVLADSQGRLRVQPYYVATGTDGLSNTALGWPRVPNDTPVYPGIADHIFNGTSWDRRRGNAESTALTSAARTATTNSSDLTNYNGRGIAILVDVTAIVDTPNISAIAVQAKIGSNYLTIYSFTGLTINSVSQKAFLIYPGAASAAGWTAAPLQGALPRTYRLAVTHDDTDSITYSVTVVHLV